MKRWKPPSAAQPPSEQSQTCERRPAAVTPRPTDGPYLNRKSPSTSRTRTFFRWTHLPRIQGDVYHAHPCPLVQRHTSITAPLPATTRTTEWRTILIISVCNKVLLSRA